MTEPPSTPFPFLGEGMGWFNRQAFTILILLFS